MGEQVFRDLTDMMAAHKCLDCIRLKQSFRVEPSGQDRFEVTVTMRRIPERLG